MAASGESSSIRPFLIAALGVAGFALFTAVLFGGGETKRPRLQLGDGDGVGLVELIGPIVESRPIIDALDQLAENRKVKAIVLRVDSPGGSVGPSQEIYHSVLRIREHKPVVVSMGSVAASGGFYIASAGSKVLANSGTLTGSIGVIMAFADVTELLDWAKIRMEVIKTGQFKDSGSGYRPMTTPERDYLQNLMDEVLEQFVVDVATARNATVTIEAVREVADGRVFTGATAQSLGFVDALGGYSEAVSEAAALGGIEGKPQIIEPRIGPAWYERVLEDGLDSPVDQLSSRMLPLWAVWIP